MSPNNITDHSDHPEVPLYVTHADMYIKRAETADSAKKQEFAAYFIKTIRLDALRGNIKQRNGEGEPYTPEVFENQLSYLVEDLSYPSENNTEAGFEEILRSVPNANGLRISVGKMLRDENLGMPMYMQMRNIYGPMIEERTGEPLPMPGVTEVYEIHANDATQPEEAPAKAEKPAQTKEEALNELRDQLSENDWSNLRQYAEADADMKAARVAGEGVNAQYWEQQKGQAYLKMSEKAKAIKERFAYLYN